MKSTLMAVAFAAALIATTTGQENKLTPQQVFERRILPIFKSPNPSSCVECHLSGVELKNYILPSGEKTFASLRDLGLVNLENPAESKILRLISMGEEGKGAALIKNSVRKAEYEAFAEWIKACCADPKLREAPKLEPKELAGPKRPNEVIRHGRTDRLLESFERNIWSQRQRCLWCHHPDGGNRDKVVAENGEEVIWMKREGAEATMRALMSGKLLNLKTPERSLLLLKPTNQVKHGGGQKMLVGDMAYKAFREWIEDVAKIVGDKYAREADLPRKSTAPELFSTKFLLKIDKTPPAWADKLLQATLFAWDGAKKAWEPDPVAMSDRAVWGKGKLWQHELVLLAVPGSERAKAWRSGAPSLPPGRYLVKVHVDLAGRLERDWKAALGKAEFAGQAELDAKWSETPTVIDAAQLRR